MRARIRATRWFVLGVAGFSMVALTVYAQTRRTVDTATLLNPPPGEWVMHGLNYAETRHSPLKQVDSSTVSRLGLAWSVEVGSEGKIETTPIVFDGVLYGTSTWSQVYAVDLRTKQVKWRWDPAIVRGGYREAGPRACCGMVNRGVALYEGKVYVGLLDGRLVALDAETGRPVWAVQTTPPNSDYSITGAPRVVKGKVIIGNGGAEYGVRGYVTAYDAATGRRAWRFYLVPGDPSKPFEDPVLEMAAKTWTGEWWKYGGGGTAWDGLSYDAEADLLYIGTGNGSPWNQNHRSPGGGDNLFLSSIVAIKPDTGTYVWHYQTTPGDNWDYNAAQQMILADLTIDGRLRKVLLQAPKNGFFYVLDRITGEFISAQPFVNVTWATGIDPKTGRPIETPEARYGFEGARLSPSPVGAHHWPPMSFNPATGLVYFPGQETTGMFTLTETFNFQEGQWNLGMSMGGARGGAGRGAAGAGRGAPAAGRGAPPAGRGAPAARGNAAPPAAPPAAAGATATPAPAGAGGAPRGTPGFLVAWDPIAQKARWRNDFIPSGGTLSTAGSLVFVGDNTGRFMALDAATGKTLWEQMLFPGVATPITYELDGRQYIAVMSGTSRGRVFTFALDGKEPMPSRTP